MEHILIFVIWSMNSPVWRDFWKKLNVESFGMIMKNDCEKLFRLINIHQYESNMEIFCNNLQPFIEKPSEAYFDQ